MCAKIIKIERDLTSVVLFFCITVVVLGNVIDSKKEVNMVVIMIPDN